MLPVYFVRHGESVNNTLMEQLGIGHVDTFERQRAVDAPLTDNGKQQAAAAGSWIATHIFRDDTNEESLAAETDAPTARNYDGVVIWSSYLERALYTAEALHTRMPGSKVVVHGEIFEAGGCYKRLDEEGEAMKRFQGHNGRTSSQVAELFPSFTIPPEHQRPEGWWSGRGSKEPKDETARRARELTREINDLADRIASGDAAAVEIRALIIVTHGSFYRTWMHETFGFTEPPDTAVKRIDRSADSFCAYASNGVKVIGNTAFSKFYVPGRLTPPTVAAATSSTAAATVTPIGAVVPGTSGFDLQSNGSNSSPLTGSVSSRRSSVGSPLISNARPWMIQYFGLSPHLPQPKLPTTPVA